MLKWTDLIIGMRRMSADLIKELYKDENELLKAAKEELTRKFRRIGSFDKYLAMSEFEGDRRDLGTFRKITIKPEEMQKLLQTFYTRRRMEYRISNEFKELSYVLSDPNLLKSSEFKRGEETMKKKYENYYDTNNFDSTLNVSDCKDGCIQGIVYFHRENKSFIPAKLASKIDDWILEWKMRMAIGWEVSLDGKSENEEWIWNILGSKLKISEIFKRDNKNFVGIFTSFYDSLKDKDEIIKFEPIMTEIGEKFRNVKVNIDKRKIIWNDHLEAFDKVWSKKTFELVSKESDEYLFNELISKLSSVTFKDKSLMIQQILLKGVLELNKIASESIKNGDKLMEIERIVDGLMKLKNVYV